MDANYLCDHLLKYIRLCATEKQKKTCFAYERDEMFFFGYVKDGERQVNKITRQVAIAISMSLNYYLVMKQAKEKNKIKIIKRRRKIFKINNYDRQ